jgi:hypothetical protein
MSTYQQGKNWSSAPASSKSGGGGGATFSNGQGQVISNPQTYFAAVAENRYGYNSGYANGHGQAIESPKAYFSAVGELGWSLVHEGRAEGGGREAENKAAGPVLPDPRASALAHVTCSPCPAAPAPAASDKYGYNSRK